jgi:hypothetical protein
MWKRNSARKWKLWGEGTQVEMLEMKTAINQNPQWIVSSADKIKQNKEYQNWKTRLRRCCIQSLKKNEYL